MKIKNIKNIYIYKKKEYYCPPHITCKTNPELKFEKLLQY